MLAGYYMSTLKGTGVSPPQAPCDIVEEGLRLSLGLGKEGFVGIFFLDGLNALYIYICTQSQQLVVFSSIRPV